MTKAITCQAQVPFDSVLIRVTGYEELTDMFSFCAVGFTDLDKTVFPAYSLGAPDFDDFQLPGIIVPHLIGEYGEPDEFMGNVYAIPYPIPAGAPMRAHRAGPLAPDAAEGLKH